MSEEATFPTCFKLSNVPSDWKDKTLEDHCKQYGELKRSTIWRNLRSGESKGYALIEYATPEDAKKAATELDGSKPEGSRMTFKVEVRAAKVPAKPKAEGVASPSSGGDNDGDVPPNTNMQVRYIPRAWDDKALMAQVEKYGKLRRCTVWRSWKTQASKGYGLVEFETIEAAQACKEGLSGTTFPTCPKPCVCVYSYPKGDERRGQRVA